VTMATYLVFGRTRYAEPLALLTSVESDAPPDRHDLDDGNDWLELVAVPEAEAIWVIRDAHLVVDRAEAAT
jgi:hypothetical protein